MRQNMHDVVEHVVVQINFFPVLYFEVHAIFSYRFGIYRRNISIKIELMQSVSFNDNSCNDFWKPIKMNQSL